MSTGTFSLLTSDSVFDTNSSSQYVNRKGGTTSIEDPSPCNSNDLATKVTWDSVGYYTVTFNTDLTCSSKPSPSQAASSCPRFGPNGSITAIDAHYNLPTSIQDSGCYLTSQDYSTKPTLKGGSSVPLVCTYNYSDVAKNFTIDDSNFFLTKFQKNPGSPDCSYQYLDDPQKVYNTLMGSWCGQDADPLDTYTPIKLTSGPTSLICKKWCQTNSDACKEIYLSYCGGNNQGGNIYQFLDPECSGANGFCANSQECDALVTNFCQDNLSPEEAMTYPVCGCALKQSFYQNYFGDLTKNFDVSAAVTEALPQCFYGPCASSPIKLSTQRGQCPDVSSCIQVGEVNADGNITGGITINQDLQCGSVITPKVDTKYSCQSGVCQEDPNGEYGTKEDCESSGCSPSPSPTSYTCGASGCVADPNGEYQALQDCQQNCKKKASIPPYIIYTGLVVLGLVLLIIGVKLFRK